MGRMESLSEVQDDAHQFWSTLVVSAHECPGAACNRMVVSATSESVLFYIRNSQ